MMRHMRTTLDIDPDVLQAAKELAAQRRSTAGKVLSELARRGLEPSRGAETERHGVRVLPPRPEERSVTPEDVIALRDEA